MPPRRNPSDDDADLQPIVDASVNAFFRLNPRAQLLVIVLLLIAGAIAFLVYRQTPSTAAGPESDSADLALGNPSNAIADPSNSDNYLMVKPYYALSYNSTKGTPNWVSWRVTEADLGEAPRKDDFDTDVDLPSSFYRVTQDDYSGSGFDRGHMCPHSDRAANQQMSFATFVMSNIIPQAPNVNRKAWARLEDYCRELVRNHDRLYITAGPVGQGGRGSRGARDTLAQGRVVVPSACWKVVVDIPDTGSDSLVQIGIDARVITVEMPNDNEIVGEDWNKFRITAAKVEQQTGLHFFSKLPLAVADRLRQKLDQVTIPPSEPRTEYRPED